MINITEELKAKLIAAKSAEEVAALVKADGQEITAKGAEQLLKEIGTHKPGSELSLDELESVSGGADRDWVTDGCAATVEADSWCSSNDGCFIWDITYSREPESEMCPKCRINTYIDYKTSTRTIYKCPRCGYTKEDEYMKDAH